MEPQLEAIRAAIQPEASHDAKSAGVIACRTILAALEPSAHPPAPSPMPIASMVQMLRGVPADQLLDLAITRLRAALPTDTPVTMVQSMKLQLVPVPPIARSS